MTRAEEAISTLRSLVASYPLKHDEWQAVEVAIEALQEQRPHGEWIRNDNGTYSCNVCHSWIPEEQHYYARYCLHCGRTMREEGDEK